MGFELIRSQVRDRGSPYAGLGESHGMLFLEIGDPDIGGGNYLSGLQPITAPGTRGGTVILVFLRVGFGLAARRGRPGGVRDYGTTTTYPWELPFGSRSTECTYCTARGTVPGDA